MATYDNTNRGVLFDNDRKEQDTHPDMTGTLNVNGVDHWFSAWWKDGQRGEFLSLSLGKPKEQQLPSVQRQPEAPPRRGNRPSNAAPSHDGFKARQLAPRSAGYDDDRDPPF